MKITLLALALCACGGAEIRRERHLTRKTGDVDAWVRQWRGTPFRFAIHLEGPDADDGKRARCLTALRHQRLHVKAVADMTVTLKLAGENRIVIVARGQTRVDEALPGWGMEELCWEALARAASTFEDVYLDTVPAGAPPAVADAEADPPAETPPPRRRHGR